jgi:hypothetical protein
VSQTKGKDWQREKPGEPVGVKSWVGIEGDDTDKCGGSRPIAKAAGASSQAAANVRQWDTPWSVEEQSASFIVRDHTGVGDLAD